MTTAVIKTPVNSGRRAALLATSVVGGAGLTISVVPFVASMAPSERARAQGGAVEVDLLDMQPGEIKVVEWRRKPMFVLRRSPAMLDALSHHDDQLSDPASERSEQPEYARNAVRAARPEILLLEAVCTHLGCIPSFRPVVGASDLGGSWPGGFYCPCHGSKFDLAGRVFKGSPAPTNLRIPAYRFPTDSTLVIGVDPKKHNQSYRDALTTKN